jgi:hypothetical protein
MCLNCGCGQLEERHGHPENITSSDLRRAARVNGQTLADAARNVAQAVDHLTRGQVPASSGPIIGMAGPRR